MVNFLAMSFLWQQNYFRISLSRRYCEMRKVLNISKAQPWLFTHNGGSAAGAAVSRQVAEAALLTWLRAGAESWCVWGESARVRLGCVQVECL